MLFIRWNDVWHHVSEFRRWELSKDRLTLRGWLASASNVAPDIKLDATKGKGLAIVQWLATVTSDLGGEQRPPSK